MAHRVCPWWFGYFLASPLRRLIEDPQKILAGHVETGMTVLDIGCGMGFFSLPLTRLVGPEGRVVCVDLQPQMIKGLNRRARRKGLTERIDSRICAANSLGIDDLASRVDFVLAYAVIHEVPDVPGLLKQIKTALTPGGRLLIAEPKGHVKPKEFAETVSLVHQAGFKTIDQPQIKRSLTLLAEAISQ